MAARERFWFRFLSGGGRVDFDDPEFLRVAMINVVGGVAGLLWLVFLVRNAWRLPETGNLARVLVDLFGVVASVGILVAMRLRVAAGRVAQVANVGVFAATLGVISLRSDPAFSLMLLPLYPVLAFFLLEDVAQGIGWSALATGAVCVMISTELGPWSQLGPPGFDAIGTVVAVMIMVSITMAVYFTSRRQVLGRLERLRAELAEESIRDPLTGVNNRRMLEDYLVRYLARAARGPDGLAVALLDIDHFKAFNDTHGHPAGDEFLQAVAGALNEVFCRGEDVVVRVGGEEFCVLCFYREEAEATRMFQRAQEAIAGLGYPSPGGPRASVTASAGLARVPPGDRRDAETVYAEADAALYRAKAAGRAQLARAADATA